MAASTATASPTSTRGADASGRASSCSMSSQTATLIRLSEVLSRNCAKQRQASFDEAGRSSNLLTYSLTHLLTYSLTHLLTYSLTHLLPAPLPPFLYAGSCPIKKTTPCLAVASLECRIWRGRVSPTPSCPRSSRVWGSSLRRVLASQALRLYTYSNMHIGLGLDVQSPRCPRLWLWGSVSTTKGRAEVVANYCTSYTGPSLRTQWCTEPPRGRQHRASEGWGSS